MVNLFPEIKVDIENVLRSDVLLKNSDIELQQRALEYFKVVRFKGVGVYKSEVNLARRNFDVKWRNVGDDFG